MSKTEIHTDFVEVLKVRFVKNILFHSSLDWEKVEAKLLANPKKIKVLEAMEATGGEPDVVGLDSQTGAYIFFDCSAETPLGRRNLCYDRAALDARKTFKPKNSVQDLAKEIGIEILTETQYRELQTLGQFDLKTSSWVQTPENVRKLGGALFMDRRFDTVFVYHNGAESYYGARGFRGVLTV